MDILLEPVWIAALEGLGPRLLDYLFARRDDVRERVARSEAQPERALEQAKAWFYLWGLKECGLEAHVPTGERLRLWDTQEHDIPVFLYYAWLMIDRLNSYDITTKGGRELVFKWFEEQGSTALWDPRPAPERASPGPKVNVFGYVTGELGIGEDARTTVAALDAVGTEVTIIDLSRNIESRKDDRRHVGRIAAMPQHDISILCMTAFDTGSLFVSSGETFGRQYIIGYWPWELDCFPRGWEYTFGLVNEVWASSTFTKSAMLSAATVPVLQMPLALDVNTLEAVKPRAANSCVQYLYVFDSLSQLSRKNPQAVVRAFKLAFPTKYPDVQLILKAMNPRHDTPLWSELKALCSSDDRISLITETLPYAELLSLIRSCDVYVSLHRAEGFGRTVAEAMYFGKPVIATGWSGSDELVTSETAIPISFKLRPVESGEYPWSRGASWAEPSVEHCARAMLDLYHSPSKRSELGARARAHVLARHHPLIVGRKYAERLEEIRRQRTSLVP